MNKNKEILSSALSCARNATIQHGLDDTICQVEDSFLDKRGNSYFDSIWYGGEIFVLDDYFNWDKHIAVSAIGDVEATLRDRDGNILVKIRDKKNRGHFRKKIQQYLHGDGALRKAIEGKNPNGYCLEIKKSNHYEISYYERARDEDGSRAWNYPKRGEAVPAWKFVESIALDGVNIVDILNNIEGILFQNADFMQTTKDRKMTNE